MSAKKPRLARIAAIARSPRSLGSPRTAAAERSPLDTALGAFRVECEDAIHALRQALQALARAAAADPLRPQEVSRQFGINKNLTWKFARVLLASDPFEAIAMLPGAEGVEIYLRAFEQAGVERIHTEGVRLAMTGFDRVVARHFGDRSQLELVLDGIRTDGNLESSRRLAFRGMSGVFGLQARLRLTIQILSPNRGTPDKGDVTQIVGLAGLQRLRPIGALPVFRLTGTQQSGTMSAEPLFRGADGATREYLLRECSTYPDASVSAHAGAGRTTVELSDGPLGRIGESDLYFGSVVRGTMNLRRQPDDACNNFITSVSVPAENLLLDVYAHRSFEGTESLQASVHSTLAQPLSSDESQQQQSMLPIDTAPVRVEELTEFPDMPALPSYRRIVARGFEDLGIQLRDYRLFRVALAYPPAPSAVLVRWTLPA
jgi:hypothetical protein